MNLAIFALSAALAFGALSPRVAAQSWDSLRVLNAGDRIKVLETAGTDGLLSN